MATDKRVRYTKMFLKESLIKLMQEKPISRITIKELCEGAEINRATYYAHYTDQFDQLKQIEAEFMDSINSYLDSFEPEADGSQTLQMTERILEYIENERDLCRVLLGKNGDVDFMENITGILSERVLAAWQVKLALDPVTGKYVFEYVALGSIGVVRKWLFDKENYLTPREIAKYIVLLANRGLDSLAAGDGR